MKFRFLLLILGWRMGWLARRREGFRAQLEQRDIVMQWRTFDGAVARWYHFQPGRVSSHAGLYPLQQSSPRPQPSLTLNFRDANYAVRTLQAAGNSQMAFMEGVQAGDIKIEGDASHLMWFMTLMKYITPAKKEK